MIDKRVEIGGELRPVNFGRNALVEYEELSGTSLLNGQDLNLISFKGMRILVYVGLKWGLYKGDGKEPKPSFNLLQVGNWLEEDDMSPTGPTAKIMQIFMDSMPKPKNAGAGENPA